MLLVISNISMRSLEFCDIKNGILIKNNENAMKVSDSAIE